MAFGQRSQRDEQEKPTRMTWDGTEKRAREIEQWGRDDALLPIVAVTPPSRDAGPGTPEAQWRIRALVPVASELGGGVQWVDVPKGAVIRNTNTGTTAWTEPVLAIVTSRGTAAAFDKE
jgi:hypothetical protein